MKPKETAAEFHPCVPEQLADSALYGIRLRGCELDILLHGFGTRIESMTLDGVPVQNPIPYGCGKQILEIWLRR